MSTNQKNLEIIYHDGKPDGIRSIRRLLSTMTTYVIPRPLFYDSKNIKGVNQSGIYYLINENDDNKIAQIYIGQTRNGIDRLDDHNRRKVFWNKAILFLADNKTFTLDIISGLETYAINKAIESNRYKVENTNNSKYKISEYYLPLIEEIYEEIKFIMATLGYKMDNSISNLNKTNALYITRKNLKAFGIYYGEKFEILEGSEININRKCNSDNMEKQRQTAIKNGNIININGKFKLNVSMSFNSPSSAAMFVLGSNANGWTEWKNEDGQKLDELFRK